MKHPLNVLLLAGLVMASASVRVSAQYLFTETFKNATAPGWQFYSADPSNPPRLTSGTIDPAGEGWLRMNKNTYNQATMVYYDTAFQAPGTSLTVNFDFANWDCKGADGFTFFLMDGSVSGAWSGNSGGSLAYAQGSGISGLTKAWLGIGFDNFGNFSNPTEGRVGGPGFIPNSVTVRGSGKGAEGYAWVATENLNAYGQMDFPDYTSRPNQTGADYRHATITLGGDNVLMVAIQFGAGSAAQTVLKIDLDDYATVSARPATWKMGFTAATGGEYEIHELRNLTVDSSVPIGGGSPPVVPEPSTYLFAMLALGGLPLVQRVVRRAQAA